MKPYTSVSLSAHEGQIWCVWSAARRCYSRQSRGKQIWTHANRPVANFLFSMDLTYNWMTAFECDKGKIIGISGKWTCFVPTWTWSLIWIYLWSDYSWCELFYLFHTKQHSPSAPFRSAAGASSGTINSPSTSIERTRDSRSHNSRPVIKCTIRGMFIVCWDDGFTAYKNQTLSQQRLGEWNHFPTVSWTKCNWLTVTILLVQFDKEC